MRPRRRKTVNSVSSKKLSQQHKDKISKALKAYHAGKKSRKPVNDNLIGRAAEKPAQQPFNKRRKHMFQNRSLEAGHLKDLRKTNRALIHALQTKSLTDAKKGIKAQNRFKRKTKIRQFLSKFLPSNINRTKR